MAGSFRLSELGGIHGAAYAQREGHYHREGEPFCAAERPDGKSQSRQAATAFPGERPNMNVCLWGTTLTCE